MALCADTLAPELPRAFAVVVLVMELVLVLGVAFLLLLSSSVAGAVAQSVVTTAIRHTDSHAVGAVVGTVVRTCAFALGVLRFTSWFFQRSLATLTTDLGLRTLSIASMRYVACYMLVQTFVVSSVMSCERWRRHSIGVETDQALFAWANVPTTDALALLESLVLAPVREELFFRGLVAPVVWNRIGATTPLSLSSALASALFALAHLTNLRLATMSRSYVLYQVAFAWLVGAFLTLRLAVSRSLLECSALHAVTNAFALLVSPAASVAFSDPLVVASGASSC